MPRGGARPNTGGKRPNAGRKKGSADKRTYKTNELAQKAAGEGVLPLQVMLEAMREQYAAGNMAAAVAVAKDAAPYVHPRKATIQHGGAVGVLLEVVEEIVDVDDNRPVNAAETLVE